ncbi:MAG: pilus assembly protein TadE [Actinobacteria bacterium]|nr:pilus assembly protein TadE [Actinomycetota bacterium]
MAVALVLVALVGVGLVHVAAASAQRGATQAAADAAALAGAADGREAAARLARRNGAQLTSYEEVDLDVVVTVRRGRFTARARARWTATPADWREGGSRASPRIP